MEILLVIAIVVGFYMAWNIGANDVANSMADAVGSKALTVMGAVVLAAIFEFAGAFLAGGHVTDTIRKGIVDSSAFADDPNTLAVGLVCALLAAAAWLNIASFIGVPVSTTHSIVGAVAGFGIMRAGVSYVYWGKLTSVVLSWFVSPIAGGVFAFIIFKLITATILAKDEPLKAARIGVPLWTFFTFFVVSMGTIYKGLKHINLELNALESLLWSAGIGIAAMVVVGFVVNRLWKNNGEKDLAAQLGKVEAIFAILVVITSCSVAFAHGANDVANAVGPLAAVYDIVSTGELAKQVEVSPWILALGGAGITVGLATFGYRVMVTIGTKITEITPSRGVAADIGATVTVLVCSRMGLPISTTHTLVGAIIGVGLARGVTAIDSKIIRTIFVSWFATLPIVALMTMLFYWIATHIIQPLAG